MENKDQNIPSYEAGSGLETTDGGVVQAPPTDVNSLSYEPDAATPLNSQEQLQRQENRFIHFARRLDVILVFLLVLGGIGTFFTITHYKQRSSATPNTVNGYDTIQIPLEELTQGKDLSIAGASNVTINGELQLNDAFSLAPSLQPTGAKAGQIYYDKGTNQLAYYNGTVFVFLTNAPAGGIQSLNDVTATSVTSLGGASGQLGLGSGLNITSNQLNNSGVLSVQGQTGDVTLTAGAGIVINGTSFSNSGVLSVAAGSPNVTVNNDGNGNISISVDEPDPVVGTGTVTSSGGTSGHLPLFTTSQNIEDSIVTQSGLTVTITGDLSVVTGGLNLSTALTVSNGGTGATSLAANGVLVGQGTSPITSVTSGSPGLCLLSTGGAPVWAACPASNGVTSVNSLTGAVSIANASAAGVTITIDDASAVNKGIASFNATNFLVSSGAVNTVQNINSGATPTFAGVNTNTITPSAALTVGVSAQTALLQGSTTTITSNGVGNNIVLNSAGTIELQDNTNVTGTITTSGNLVVNGGNITSSGALTVGTSSQTLTLQGGAATSFRATSGGATTIVAFTNPTANTTLNFPALSAGTYTICTTSGNCSGAAVTLQGAYDNSSNPEFVLDATRGALTIRDNSTPLGANLLEVQNNTGSATYLAVTSAGVAVTGTATVTGNVNSTTGTLQTNGVTRIDNSGNALNLGAITLSGAISGGTSFTGSGNINSTTGAIQTNSTTRIDNAGNLINIAAVTASGSATFQGGNLTLGTSSQSGSVIINDGSTNIGTLKVAALGQNTIYTLPDPGAANATICLTTGNCAGTGGGVTTGGGTTNKLAKFTGSQAIGDSSISDDGTNVTVTVDVIIQGGDLTVGTTSQAASILLHDGNGQTTTLQAGNSVSNQTFILPTNTGSANQCLKQSGTGNQLVWQDCDGGSGGSSTTLQMAYANSTNPEIVLNSSVGGLTIRDNSTPLGTNLFEIQNNAGSTTYFNVTVSGVAVNGTTSSTGNINSSGGALQTNGTSRIDNSGNAVNIGNITGSGAITIASIGAGNDITINGADQFIVQDASVFNALSTFNANIDLGANDIIGTTGNINLTNFDVIGTTGNVTAGTYNGQTISSTANFTGTVAVAGNMTLTSDIAVNGGDITASGALNITPGGTLTVGVTGQQLILQGSATTKLTATGGGFTTSVGFAGTPVGAVNYNFDRSTAAGTYTICTTIGNCAGSGGGVTTSGGTTGALAKFTGAQTLGDSLLSESGSVVTVNGNLNLVSGNQFRVNGTQISSANLSNDANLAKLSASQTFTGNTVGFQNGANSTNAFNIQNVAGNRILTADSTGGQIVLGTSNALDGKLVFNNLSNINTVTILPGTPSVNRTLTLPNASGILCTDSGNCAGAGATLQTSYNFSTGGTTPKIKVNNTLLGVDIQDADTTIGADLFDIRASNGAGLGSVMFGVASTGQTTLQNAANSTTAFRLLTQGGTSILTGDTTNGQIVLGQSNTLSGVMVFRNATSLNTVTLSAPTATSNQVITLPNASGAICLTSGNCVGAGSTSTLQAAYDAGNIITTTTARDINFALADTATDGNFLVDLQCDTSCSTNGRFAIQDDGVDTFTISPAGGQVVIKNSVNSGTEFQVQRADALALLKVDSNASATTVNGDFFATGIQPASSVGNGTGGGFSSIQTATGGNTTGTTGQTAGNGGSIFLSAGNGGTAPAGSANGWGGNVLITGGTAGAGAGSGGFHGNVILQGTGGPVGIGTLSPGTSYKLDVAGDINISTGSSYRINGVAICTSSGCTAASGSGNYIQNQSASQQATSSYWISGNGRVDGILLTPTLDTATAVPLNIGTTNATAINLNKATTVTGNLNQSGGTFSLSGNAASSVATTSGTLTLQSVNASNNIVINGSTNAMTLNTGAAGTITVGSATTTTVNVGAQTSAARTINVGFPTSTLAQTINIGAPVGNVAIQGGTGSTAITLTAALDGSISATTTGLGTITLASAAGAIINANTTVNGNETVQAQTNSTSVFKVLNATGGNLFNIDSTNAGTATLFGLLPGEVSPWTTATNALPAARYGGNGVTANGYIYELGGNDTANNSQSTVYYAKINTDGSVGTWTTATNPLPLPRTRAGSIVANGYVYVAGGVNSSATALATVYYAKLNTDGSVGTWQTATNPLPAGRQSGSMATANGYAYYMGGKDTAGVTHNDVYYAKLNADGSVGSWTTSANAITQERNFMSTVINNGYLYVMGGQNTAGTQQSTIYYSKLSATDGSNGAWSTAANSPPTIRAEAVPYVSNGYVYLVGGQDSGGYRATVYYARLNADGTVGTWATSTNPLPANRSSVTGVIANGYMYAVGGFSGTLATATVYYASTARVQIGASLDLVGLQGQTLAEGGSDANTGSTGGSITAGNGRFVGALDVIGQVNFTSSLNVNGAFSVDDTASFQNGTDSAKGFQVLNAAGVPLFTMDTTTSRAYVGNPTADSTGALLILDTRNAPGDPAGVNGGSYYNSTREAFRCYEDNAWRDCMNSGRLSYNYASDMVGTDPDNNISFLTGNSGTVSGSTIAGLAGHPGIVTFGTGATTNGYGGASAADATGRTFIFGGGTTWTFNSLLRIPTVSNGTDTFTVRSGMIDDLPTDGVDGCMLKYSHGLNGGKWQGICENNSVQSNCDTTIAVVAGTWYNLQIVINSAGTSVDFRVNDVSKCQVTTNIPTAAGRETSWNTTITKSLGTAARTMDLDYLEVRGEFGAGR